MYSDRFVRHLFRHFRARTRSAHQAAYATARELDMTTAHVLRICMSEVMADVAP